MIEEHKDVKGKKKLVIQKLHNPNTGICSGSLTEFSTAAWNQATLNYLESVQELDKKRLKTILEEASALVKKGKRQECFSQLKSSRSALHSDNEESRPDEELGPDEYRIVLSHNSRKFNCHLIETNNLCNRWSK